MDMVAMERDFRETSTLRSDMDGHQHHHQHHQVTPSMVQDSQDQAGQHMDHSMMGTHHGVSPAMDHMMMMYFHGGYNEVILFDIWRISTLGGLIGSMVGCFILGILYEGVKSYREYWMRGTFQTVKYNQVQGSHNRSSVEHGSNSTNDNQSDQGSVKFIETKMWSLAHVVLTVLHMIQLTLAYFLMLIVMTYNTWLCMAVVLGSTVGYFLVGWRKATVVDVSDHCH